MRRALRIHHATATVRNQMEGEFGAPSGGSMSGVTLCWYSTTTATVRHTTSNPTRMRADSVRTARMPATVIPRIPTEQSTAIMGPLCAAVGRDVLATPALDFNFSALQLSTFSIVL